MSVIDMSFSRSEIDAGYDERSPLLSVQAREGGPETEVIIEAPRRRGLFSRRFF